MLRILVPGGTGQVGWELQAALAPLGAVIAPDRRRMDLANPDSIRRAIRDAKPDIIVNAAAYTAVDKAESEPDLAMQVNGVAPGIIAEEAKRLGAILVHYSTDYVFDGELDRPYTEEDVANPINTYGKSKLAGERAIEAVSGVHLILRTSGVYSARGSNFVLTILRLSRERPEISVVDDQSGSPTWARALAQATADLLSKHDTFPHLGGIYHLSAAGYVSRYDFARAIIREAREISCVAQGWADVKAISTALYPLPARRPRRPHIDNEKIRRASGIAMREWRDQLRAFLASRVRAGASGFAL